jgi:ubiquinone/menaquinone biosynthesis C-methylase UbiE
MEVTEYFSGRAKAYAEFRPLYPESLIEFLHELLPAPATIADVGAGTGILSGQLLKAGYNVLAIEPNAAMRAEADHRLSGQSGFQSLSGAAEATTLPPNAVDGITCAQSFHWFDRARSRIEFERILRPPKLVLLIWNEEVLEGPMLEYTRILQAATPEFNSFNWKNIRDSDLAAFFSPGRFKRFYFPNPQRLDRSVFTGRLLSASHVPVAGQPGYEALMKRATTFFDQNANDGYLQFSYLTRVDMGIIG